MKRISVTLLFGILLHWAGAQNLVPNPSFEDHWQCPTHSNEMVSCKDWGNFGNSPDYFSTCGPSSFMLPNVGYGYQYPHSGNFHVGLALLQIDTSNGPNYREYVGIQLASPTVIGVKYFISFYCNVTGPFGIACNKMGVKLSTVPFDSCCQAPITNSAQLYSDSIISDTADWSFITGSFISDSVYNYLILGNFFADQNTDTINLLPVSNSHAYYYFDDICISTDSIYNQTWTSINELDIKDFKIYPNPFHSTLIIEGNSKINKLTVYDIAGREIKNEFVDNHNVQLDFDFFPPGFYFITLFIGNKSINKLIIHF